MTDYIPTSHINLAKPFPDVGFGGNNNGFNKFLILFLIILIILVLF